MTNWKKNIVDALMAHYFASAPAAASGDKEERYSLRIRSALFFPNFDSASPDEKESYLEAAESLERDNITQLRWESRGRGERLKTISCTNFESLFREAGKPFPKSEVEKIKGMIDSKTAEMEKANAAEESIALLQSLSCNFGIREIGQGIDSKAMEALIRFMEFSGNPANVQKITTRALSILLYNDSKHLENVLSLCAPLLARSQKALPFQNFAIPERSYPEAMISGKIIFELKNSNTPMINAAGLLLNIPLESAESFKCIKPFSEKNEKTVLTIENKETFFALGNPDSSSQYTCFLYTGGYLNRAASVLIQLLADSGFAFFHAGDLDPDGILIMQHIGDLAEKRVTPVKMDADTFDKYRPWARTLTLPMIRKTKLIREETLALPGIGGLVQRITETGLSVEQEIIDYR